MAVGNAVRFDRLLRELYAKKQWLDTMIEALESAAHSPDHQFLDIVSRTFNGKRQPIPKVDLHPRLRTKLARLAAQVGKNGGRAARTETSPLD